MTPHERREAAETEAKQSLKRDLEAVKQTDAALSSGKKTHHFFAMQKEKAALAKETGRHRGFVEPARSVRAPRAHRTGHAAGPRVTVHRRGRR
jgi:hypothetical protein